MGRAKSAYSVVSGRDPDGKASHDSTISPHYFSCTACHWVAFVAGRSCAEKFRVEKTPGGGRSDDKSAMLDRYQPKWPLTPVRKPRGRVRASGGRVTRLWRRGCSGVAKAAVEARRRQKRARMLRAGLYRCCRRNRMGKCSYFQTYLRMYGNDHRRDHTCRSNKSWGRGDPISNK